MIGKIAYLLTFLVTIVVVAGVAPGALQGNYPATSRAHDLIVGYPVSGDRLVLRQQIFKSAVWNQIITFQQTFNISKYERITQVRALDYTANHLGGFATLVKGGPGTNNATIRFRSQRGQGIYFFVELYAKR